MFFLKHACKKKKIYWLNLFARERQWSLDGWKGFFWHGSAAGVTGVTGVWKHARVPVRSRCRSGIGASAGTGEDGGGVGWGVPAGFPPAPRTCVSGSCVFPFRFLFNAGGFHSEFSPTSPYASFPRDGANKEAIAPIINLRESLLTRPRQKRNVCPDDGRWRASLSESRWIGNAARQHTHSALYPTSAPNATATTSGISLNAQAELFNEQKKNAARTRLSLNDIKSKRTYMFKQT